MSSKSNKFAFIATEDTLRQSPIPWFIRLWAAVVRRAAVDWVLYKDHPNSKLSKLGVDADAWIFGNEDSHPLNSFESVCGMLDIEVGLIRLKVSSLTEEDARKLRGMEFGDEW